MPVFGPLLRPFIDIFIYTRTLFLSISDHSHQQIAFLAKVRHNNRPSLSLKHATATNHLSFSVYGRNLHLQSFTCAHVCHTNTHPRLALNCPSTGRVRRRITGNVSIRWAKTSEPRYYNGIAFECSNQSIDTCTDVHGITQCARQVTKAI